MKEHGHSDRRWDAAAVMSARGSPSGTEFELKISVDPGSTEPVDRPQARPVRGETQRHREVRTHARMQGMPRRKSKNQATSTRRNVQDVNIE